MKNFIGGMFKSRGDAERARTALHRNGFDASSIDLLQYTYEEKAEGTKENPSFSSIGRGALRGALLLGGIGGVIGLLVGLGVIQLPSLEPTSGATVPFQITWQFVLSSLAAGLILGGITGVIVGAASRLFVGYEKSVPTSPKTRKGDLMLAVQIDHEHRKSEARSTMKEHGAISFNEFHENWDTEVWTVLEGEASHTG